jgi:hypothetical protein
MSLSVLIVEKTGIIKPYNIKLFKEEELYKKCGFKKQDGFIKHAEWNVKIVDEKYTIVMYGKLDGKANMENKYDFPPPIDTKLFFGNCVLVGYIKDPSLKPISLNIPLWDKIYEKLFGGFEDLVSTALEDEEEEDELENISKSLKTKNGGYLKDGFVVDDSDDLEEEDDYNSEEEDELSESNEHLEKGKDKENDKDLEDISIEDIGSELSEESYDYSE